MRYRVRLLCFFAASFGLLAAPASARVGAVIAEPYGAFGTMMPSGHAALLLDDYCADGPLAVRVCKPGERPGVVISRQHDLRQPALDWLAFPLAVYLYGGDAIPPEMTAAREADLRDSYRRSYLLAVLPDHIDRHGLLHPPPSGDWEEDIGATFDRRVFLYTLAASPADEAAIVASLSSQPNVRRYRLHTANCADFAAQLLSSLVPGADKTNGAADYWLMSPKQLARTLDTYGELHPEADLQVYEVPQVPGPLRRSRPNRGAAEALLTTKRYFATVAVLQPEILLADWLVYEKRGNWKVGQDARPLPAGFLASPTHDAADPTYLANLRTPAHATGQ